MTLAQMLAAIRKKGFTGRGIGLAELYIRTALGSKQFQGRDELIAKALKESADKLVYRDPDGIVTFVAKSTKAGVKAKGRSGLKDHADALGDKSIMEFENILTTAKKDRDGDMLSPEGAQIDKDMPLLWQHLPMEPLGKLKAVVEQNDELVKTRFGIADTKSGQDAAVLVEYGALRISHGFKPIEFEPIKGAAGDEEFDGWRVRKYEVMEGSLVSIPANTGAVITAFSRGKLHSPIIKSWAADLYRDRPVMVGFSGAKTSRRAKSVNVTVNLNGGSGGGTAVLDAPAKKEVIDGINYTIVNRDGDWVILADGKVFSSNHATREEAQDELSSMRSARPAKKSCGTRGKMVAGKAAKGDDSAPVVWVQCVGCGRKFNYEDTPAGRSGPLECPFCGAENQYKSSKDGEAPDLDDEDDTETEEPSELDESQAGEMQGAVLGEIASQLDELAASGDLPAEASARLQVVAGIMGEVAQTVEDSMGQVAEAGKTLDIAGAAGAVQELVAGAHAKLVRASEEMGRIVEVENLPDHAAEQITNLAGQMGSVIDSLDGSKDSYGGMNDNTPSEDMDLDGKDDEDNGLVDYDGDDELDDEFQTEGDEKDADTYQCPSCGFVTGFGDGDDTTCPDCGTEMVPMGKDDDDTESPEDGMDDDGDEKTLGDESVSGGDEATPATGGSDQDDDLDGKSGAECPSCGRSTDGVAPEEGGTYTCPGCGYEYDLDEAEDAYAYEHGGFRSDGDTETPEEGMEDGDAEKGMFEHGDPCPHCGEPLVEQGSMIECPNCGWDAEKAEDDEQTPEAPDRPEHPHEDTPEGSEGEDTKMATCSVCGITMEKDANFCKNCGTAADAMGKDTISDGDATTDQWEGPERDEHKGAKGVISTCANCGTKYDEGDYGPGCPECGSKEIVESPGSGDEKDGDPIDSENPNAELDPEDENPGVPDEKGRSMKYTVVEQWPGAGKNVVEDGGQYYLVNRHDGERCSRIFDSMRELRRWASSIGIGS